MSSLARLHHAPPPDALVDTVDFLRLDAARRTAPEHQTQMGQFLTPPAVARFMASLFEARHRSLRILDPGAGVGSLSAALVAELCARARPPREISVTTYEVDRALLPYLHQTMDACKAHCDRAGVRFQAEILDQDFIGAAVAALNGGLFTAPHVPFQAAILNPPYRKLASDSQARRLLETLGAETTNLYTAFLSLSVGLLEPGGELVAITPRSFCNGPYFRPFRRAFLDSMALRQLHSFESRDRAFSDDEVLQENVIAHAAKAPAAQGKVVLSTSMGPDDACPTWRSVGFAQVVKPDDPERFIHIPADALSEAIGERMGHFTASLADLGLDVSTGRVVDFRVGEFLRSAPGADTVPLIYPTHLHRGSVVWPKDGSKKPNALALAAQTIDLLVPQGHYVLVKRFTSKEERRRIVAAVYAPPAPAVEAVAFENHLNYFHAQGRPMPLRLARGLAAFLNSTLVDCHFREWSGHTQVNASDLRRLGYPSLEQLEALGDTVGDTLPDQATLDQHIEEDLFAMPVKIRTADPARARRRIQQALEVLKALGLPREQQNDRSALTLLALVDLTPRADWSAAHSPLRGITEMMDFFREHYGKEYAPNTRETVRRHTVHQFVQAGLALLNPDQPDRPINSPKSVYQIEPSALQVIRSFGTPEWEAVLRAYLASVDTLRHRYAQEREMARIPLALPGKTITLTPGGQNLLVKPILEEFCPRFTPGAQPLYVGDTGDKFAHFDREGLAALGVVVDEHGKMPDVVVHHAQKGWLVLIEAVTSHGPVNPKRREELKDLFRGARAGLVFVTAFLTRRDLNKYLAEIAWETEVWVADAPSHLIHFNGERFLGPFED